MMNKVLLYIVATDFRGYVVLHLLSLAIQSFFDTNISAKNASMSSFACTTLWG